MSDLTTPPTGNLNLAGTNLVEHQMSTANRILLELISRRRIYEHIQGVPGIHMRRLERELQIPLSTLDYHLRQLERSGLVLARKEGQKKAYFVRNTMDGRDQHFLYFLRHRTTRWILLDIMENPNTSLRQLTERLPVGAPTISYHLKKLTRAEIIRPIWVGRRRSYQVVEPERLSRLFEQYRSTFRRHSWDRTPTEGPQQASAVADETAGFEPSPEEILQEATRPAAPAPQEVQPEEQRDPTIPTGKHPAG
ncbi:MAG TPA: winged helix-turn-helix transcriptional regulator [Candidatus Thermoplasmatota archaeon]